MHVLLGLCDRHVETSQGMCFCVYYTNFKSRREPNKDRLRCLLDKKFSADAHKGSECLLCVQNFPDKSCYDSPVSFFLIQYELFMVY